METKVIVSDKATNVIALVSGAIKSSPTGVSFFSIRNYTNSYGEVANHLINVGIKYQNAVAKDIEYLRNLDVTTMTWDSPMVEIFKAKEALIKAFETPSENRSKGQKNAYTHIVEGVKVHNETGMLYIYGYRQSKLVITEGVYPNVISKPETIAKNEIRKLLKTNKFVNYSIEVGNQLRANGDTIEI